MEIKFAHLRTQGVDFAVFQCDARSRTKQARSSLLADLVRRARMSGLKVDKAALAYQHGSQVEYFGTKDLVEFLSQSGVPRWTHTLSE